jgi:hippurate hydrolase
MPEDRMPIYNMKSYATAVINENPEDVKTARVAMETALGRSKVVEGLPPVMGSEDFQMLAPKKF